MIYIPIIEKEIMFKVVFLYVTLKAYNSLCLLLIFQKLENVTLQNNLYCKRNSYLKKKLPSYLQKVN